MGRKIRSGLLLMLVLALIYTQQSVIYAQNEKKAGTEALLLEGEPEQPDGEPEQPGEKPEQPGGEPEQPGGEPEQPGEKPEQPGGEPEQPEEGEKYEIKKYEIEISKADGKNGYYVSKPTVKIVHNGKYGATIYELRNGEDVLDQGRLEYDLENNDTKNEENEWKKESLIEPELFQEGRNILHIFMEDEEGNQLLEYDEVISILVDTQKPELGLTAQEGFSTWYQKEAWINVTADDGKSGSQIDQVICYVNNKIIGKTRENQSEFLITQTSESGEGVPVTVTVTDLAGNKTEKTVKLYIDNLPPTVQMNGAEDYLITSVPVTLECLAYDENRLQSCEAVIEYEKPEEETTQEIISTEEAWNLEAKNAKMIRTFQEDGIYKTTVQVHDKAKQKSEKSLQFIIDSQNPVIKMVDELQGKYLKKFIWDYPVDVFIKDFTTFVHQIQMDGRLYPIGTEVETEGRHVLQVNAVDAAGNQSVATAEFVIDHTPPKIQFHQVEEGAQYEGILKFQVESEKKEDRIEEILINGKRQTLKKENGKYQFQITDPGEYEVCVTATDFAGNVAEKEIDFEVVPEKTILEKITEPMKKVISGGEDQNKSKHRTAEAEKQQSAMLKRIVIWSIILILLVATVGLWYINKKNRTEDEE